MHGNLSQGMSIGHNDTDNVMRRNEIKNSERLVYSFAMIPVEKISGPTVICLRITRSLTVAMMMESLSTS